MSKEEDDFVLTVHLYVTPCAASDASSNHVQSTIALMMGDDDVGATSLAVALCSSILRLRDLARLNAADLRRNLVGDGSRGDLLYEDLLDRVLATLDARDDAPAFAYVAEPRDDVRSYAALAAEARRLVGHVHAGVEELVAAWAAILLVDGLRPGVALTTAGRGAAHAYVVLRVSSLRAHDDRLLADGLLGHAIRSAALPVDVVALDPALLAGMPAPRGYEVDPDGVASCAWYGSGATTIVWLEDEKE